MDSKTTKTFVGTPIVTSQPKAPKQPKEGLLKRAGGWVGEQVSSRVDPSFALGVANAFGQGVTFGTADEAIAGIASLGGYDYKSVRDAIRGNLQNFRDEDAAFAFGSEIAGSIASMVATRGSSAALSPAATYKTFANLGQKIGQKLLGTPMRKAMAGGALYGAGAAEEMEDVPAASLTGAAFGAGTQALAPIAQKLPQVMEKTGIPMTVGQMFGRGTKRLEEGLQSLPVVGTGVRAARERTMEKFSPYILNRALKPAGINIPMGLKPQAAFKRARQELRNRYENVLKDVDIKVGDDFLDDLASAVSTAKTELGEVGAKQGADLENFVIREVLGSASNGNLSGTALKQIQSKLGTKRQQAIRANDFGLASAIQEVDDELMNIFARYSPSKQAELQKLDRAYTNFIPLRRAAAQADSAMFTPARALQAVKAEERKAGATGLSRLAAGEARMQRPIEAAKRAIGAELPDSGTAERLGSMFMPIAASSGIGALGGMAAGSTDIGALGGLGFGLAGMAGGRLAYTPAGQEVLKKFITGVYSPALRSPATAGLLAQTPSDTMQSLLLGE